MPYPLKGKPGNYVHLLELKAGQSAHIKCGGTAKDKSTTLHRIRDYLQKHFINRYMMSIRQAPGGLICTRVADPVCVECGETFTQTCANPVACKYCKGTRRQRVADRYNANVRNKKRRGVDKYAMDSDSNPTHCLSEYSAPRSGYISLGPGCTRKVKRL